MSEELTAAHQDNFLMLLCYDKSAARIISSVVDEGMFSTQVYRDIAHAAITFLETFDEPIGTHLADEFDSVLNGSDKPKARMYKDVLLNMHELSKEGVNVDYCLNKLREWVNEQRFKVALTEAAEMLMSGDLSAAQERMYQYQAITDTIFDAGVYIAEEPLKFLDKAGSTQSLGIPHFDRINMGPEPGTVFLFVAPQGRGKSWFLIHAGKLLSLARNKVLHVTLEMSEDSVTERYIQSFLAISKREATTHVAKFVTNAKTGKAESIDVREIRSPTLVDADVRDNIVAQMDKIKRSVRIQVKQFPTNSIGVRELVGFMDQYERLYGSHHDALILDYLDLMAISLNNLRLETGQAMKDFRRIAGERNIMALTASQTNRTGEDTKLLTAKHLAEDFSKAFTADRILTYNQTLSEKKLGLARLFVAKSRGDVGGYTVVVSQAYSIGQFALDSALLSTDYEMLVDAKADQKDD